MSDQAVFTLSLLLTPDLTPLEFAVLDHVICGRGPEPKELPDHEAFRVPLDVYRFQESYRRFPLGAFAADFWTWRNSTGRIIHRGVRLDLPGAPVDLAYGPYLQFADWLATISATQGFVGAVTPDAPDTPPLLMFVRQRELYVVGDYEVDPTQRSAATGRPLGVDPSATPVWTDHLEASDVYS